MTTYIKGTFPVRFRRDGKDGVNVWLKYATVLDLTDSNTGKSYPSKIFNEPTAECKFIGIGKGVGDEPTQGQYYDWKKYIGDDGTSFTPKGRAIAHYTTLTDYDNATSKSVGLYLIDDPAGALLKHWNGSASVNRSVEDGDGYTTADKHLWVKDGVKWNDLGEIQGPKGDPGDDAVSYKLSSSISAIPLDNDAYPTVSSFALTAYKFVGNTSAAFDDSYQLVAIISYSGSTTPITVSTKLGSSSKMTVYLRTNGLSSGSLIKDIRSVSCYLYHGSVALDSFNILPIKAGAAGVSYFPNMRGLWQPNANPPYSWKDGSRDMVVYNKDDGTAYLFAVKTAGATNITSSPMTEAGTVNTKDWVQADAPFSMLFGNFVYTDNASVGGFVFSEEQMRSTSTKDGKSPEPEGSNCNILLNGKSGEFVANHAMIRGEIDATSGSFDRCTINNTCRILQTNGNGWFLRGGSDPTVDAPNGKPSWWLGYGGDQAGQFTITTYNPSDSSKKSELAIVPQPPSSETFYGRGILDINSIYQTLASFNQNGGMNVQIGRNIGDGITFIKNVSSNSFHAFLGDGHGCLNGVIQGYKLNVMSSGQIDISKGNTVYCNGKGTNLILPTRENCRGVLGTTGAFALDLTIIGASKARDFKVYGKSHNSTTGYITDCYLLNNDHGDNWYATMSQGDVLSLKLIYTGTSFYAYIVNMQN